MSKFEIVKSKEYKGRAKGDIERIKCPKCTLSRFIVTETGVFRKKGKPGWLKDTHKSLVCVNCLAKGEVVAVEHQ